MVSPRALCAQQKPMPVIGYFTGRWPGEAVSIVAAFNQGLSETGHVEGQNVTIEYRWAEGRYDRLPALAADLVGREVDVIAAGGFPATLTAKGATSTIPIVFLTGTDPVEDGLVVSLARPGGNLTGLSVLHTQLIPQPPHLPSHLIPRARALPLLINPTNPRPHPSTQRLQQATPPKTRQ